MAVTARRRRTRTPIVPAPVRITARISQGHTACGDAAVHGRHNFDTLWTREGFVTLDPGTYRGRHRKGSRRRKLHD